MISSGSSQAPKRPQESHAVIGRRTLIRSLLSLSIVSTMVGVLTPILGYLWPPLRSAEAGGGRVQVGSLLDIPPGTGKIVPIGDKPVIIVHTQEGEIQAFGAVCPHLGCVVEWDEPRQFVLCPCHDARFNVQNGAVISGPSPAPLLAYTVTVEGNEIYVGGA